MKPLIIATILSLSLSLLGDVAAIQFYVFERRTFESHLLNPLDTKKGKELEELTPNDISKSEYVAFKGMTMTFPVSIRFSDKAMHYDLTFKRPLFGDNSKNSVAYRLAAYSSVINKGMNTEGTVVMMGVNKLSVNTDWKSSEFVVILISRNLKK